MRVIFLLIFLSIFQALYSQQEKDTTYKPPFDINRIQEGVKLSRTSDTTDYHDYYLWNDRRNLSEILNERAGYFINNLGFGQRNAINYNGYNEKQLGIFRDGIQINDNFFGGFDIENISVNEIDKIEEISNISSFIYGINTYGKSINIVSKDIFQPKPFSQLRYSQDRSGSLFAEGLFALPLSKKVSVQVAANNHSLDGRYANTDFNVWRTRTRVNFYPSPKFNIKFNLYYNKIQRGLNEGLVYNPDSGILIDDEAAVENTDAYEKLTNFYYDAIITGRLFPERNSLTKLKIYSSNSIREYRDEENRATPNGRFVTNNFHSVQYAADLKQNIFFRPSRSITADILLGGNFHYNRYNFTNIVPPEDSINTEGNVTSLSENYISLIAKTDISVYNILVSGSYKTDIIGDSIYSGNFGIEGVVPFISSSDFTVSANAGYRQTHSGINYQKYLFPELAAPLYSSASVRYIEGGVKFRYKNLGVSLLQYDNELLPGTFESGNYSVNYASRYIDGYLNINKSTGEYFPDWHIKADISYHNFFFNNNLNLRAGFNVKYIHELQPAAYSQYLYTQEPQQAVTLENLFNLDFYIGARIGSANINLTVANIFNTLFYDTFIYPGDDRGGALNSVSRFTIVWDFLD